MDNSEDEQLTEQAENALSIIYQSGFNIYQLINRFKKQIGWPKHVNIPAEVIIKVCEQYLMDHLTIKAQYPWFLRVLESETRQWQARQNIKEHEDIKNQDAVPIAELLGRGEK